MEIQEGNATQTSTMLLAPKTAWPKAQTLASSSNVSSAVVELAQVAMNLAQRYPVTLKKGQLEWLVDPFDSRFMNIHRKMCYIMLQLCIDACTSVYGYAPLYTLDTVNVTCVWRILACMQLAPIFMMDGSAAVLFSGKDHLKSSGQKVEWRTIYIYMYVMRCALGTQQLLSFSGPGNDLQADSFIWVVYTKSGEEKSYK